MGDQLSFDQALGFLLDWLGDEVQVLIDTPSGWHVAELRGVLRAAPGQIDMARHDDDRYEFAFAGSEDTTFTIRRGEGWQGGECFRAEAIELRLGEPVPPHGYEARVHVTSLGPP